MRQNSIHFFWTYPKKIFASFEYVPLNVVHGIHAKKRMNFSIQNIGGMKMLNGTKHKTNRRKIQPTRIGIFDHNSIPKNISKIQIITLEDGIESHV